ncbi:MAG TPA: DUF4326 domain-containing protein [Planctomycetota bacterium]|nr:DUF4326 domain-containing protein [Planctomycetota bacterium]
MPHPLVVHCKRAPYDVYIGRPSPWGNPFRLGDEAQRAEVVAQYRAWVMAQPEFLARIRRELRGKRLGCWCAPRACHGDVLAQIANA